MTTPEVVQLTDFLGERLRRERFADAPRWVRIVAALMDRLRPAHAYLAPMSGCNGTHRFTRQWASSAGYDHESVIEFVEQNGGSCDCEVIFNVEPLTW